MRIVYSARIVFLGWRSFQSLIFIYIQEAEAVEAAAEEVDVKWSKAKTKMKKKTYNNQPTQQGHIYIYYIPQDHIQKIRKNKKTYLACK